MRRLVRGTGAALAALGMIATGAGQASAGGVAPTPVHVRELSTSSEPAGVGWLEGRRLHTPRGDTLVMPWTKQAAEDQHLRIVGHRPGAWIVKDFDGGSWRVWSVTGGERTKLFSVGVSEGDIVTIVQSLDAKRFATLDFDGDDTSVITIRNAAGKRAASRTFVGEASILDFSGPRAVVGTSDTQLWWINDPEQENGSVEDLGVDASGASLLNNLLLVRDSGTGEVGPTPLNNPGVPAWTAPMTQPRITSAGGRVVSRVPMSQELEVRSIGSGALLHRFEVSFLTADAPTWADNHTFAFIGATTGLGDRERLVTCTVKGRCKAPSVVRPEDRISLPPL